MNELKGFLELSTLINYGILTLWFFLFRVAHEPLYRLHSRWFQLSPAYFDALHYGGMTIYKILVLIFNLVPLIVLTLMQTRG